ncbi:unnamed protein product [Amoebophrya sp. A25]|nr:unnamed protein product [Amoebophrya sp. A25]|eukprot:GSA25T00000311001.1
MKGPEQDSGQAAADEERRWKEHLSKQNRDYDTYDRMCSDRIADVSGTRTSRTAPLVQPPGCGGFVSIGKDGERKKNKDGKEKKKKKEAREKDAADRVPATKITTFTQQASSTSNVDALLASSVDSITSTAGDINSTNKSTSAMNPVDKKATSPELDEDTEALHEEWRTELEWRTFLNQVRQMIRLWSSEHPSKSGKQQVRMPCNKFDQMYMRISGSGTKIKFPFCGAQNMYTVHEWLAGEKGFCEYKNNWEWIALPSDDSAWKQRLEEDPLFFVVSEGERFDAEILEVTTEKAEILKEKAKEMKKVTLAKEKLQNTKTAYSLQRGEQNRCQVQRAEEHLAQVMRVVEENNAKVQKLESKQKMVEEKKRHILRFRTPAEIKVEQERRELEKYADAKRQQELSKAMQALSAVAAGGSSEHSAASKIQDLLNAGGGEKRASPPVSPTLPDDFCESPMECGSSDCRKQGGLNSSTATASTTSPEHGAGSRTNASGSKTRGEQFEPPIRGTPTRDATGEEHRAAIIAEEEDFM